MAILPLVSFPQDFPLNKLLHASKHLLWAIAVGCIIVYCHFATDSKLKKFLSFPIWMPIEKVGYSLFLMHIGVMAGPVIGSKTPVDFDLNQVASSKPFNASSELSFMILF
jgi:hypothetical protein